MKRIAGTRRKRIMKRYRRRDECPQFLLLGAMQDKLVFFKAAQEAGIIQFIYLRKKSSLCHKISKT